MKILTKNKIVATLCCLVLIMPLASSIPSTHPQTNTNRTTAFIFTVSLPTFSSQTTIAPNKNTYLTYPLSNNYEYLDEPGKPQLLKKSITIQIPLDAHNIKAEIITQQSQQTHISFPILPADVPQITNKTGTLTAENIFSPDQTFYTNHDEFYPQNNLQIDETGRIREIKFVKLNVYPLRYRPLDNTLESTKEMTIKVSWQSSTEITSSAPLSQPFQQMTTDMGMLNVNDKKQNGLNERGNEPCTFTGSINYVANPASTSNKADYLIITADSFYRSLSVQNLANHRALHTGLNVSIINTSAIYHAVGSTIPWNSSLADTDGHTSNNYDLKIKTFINYAYRNWDLQAHKLRYILLVGDVAPAGAAFIVPAHISTLISYHELILTDYWYSCINDDNGNGQVNDTDTIADLIIGRFSVQTELDTATMVSKTIHYELFPPADPSRNWSSRALVTSGFAGNDSSWNHMQIVQNQYLIPHLLETQHVYATDYNATESDYLRAISKMKEYINNGCVLYIHNSHGCELHWRIGDEPYEPFDLNTIASLANGNKLPVVFSLACSTEALDYQQDPCFAEQWVRVANKGAVAFLGSTRTSYLNQNNELINQIMNAMLNEHNEILGSSIVEGKLNMSESCVNNRLMYNLLGDPALDMSQTLAESQKPELSCSLDSFDIPDQTHLLLHAKINNIGKTNADNVLVELFQHNISDMGNLISEATHHVNVPATTEVPLDILISLQPGWVQGFSTDLYLVVNRLHQIDEICQDNDVCPEPLHFFIEQYPTKYVSSGSYPAIYQDKIVYQDRRDGNNDIFLYNCSDGTESRITSNLSDQTSPAISRNTIVWQDMRNGNSDIYLYDLGPDGRFGTADDSGEIQITTNGSYQGYPSIDGDKIVWQDTRNKSFDIYLYDRSTGREYPVTSNPYEQYLPAISGTKILWENSSSDIKQNPGFFAANITMYDLGPDGIFGTADDVAEKKLPKTSEDNQPMAATLDGNTVVWQESRKGNCDIYLYDLGPDGLVGTEDDGGEVRVTTDPSYQTCPTLNGNMIVWQDNRNGNSDIYLYDVKKACEVQITTDTLNQGFPVIYGKNIVYQSPVNKLYLTTYVPPDQVPSQPCNPTPGNNTHDILLTLHEINWSASVDPDGDPVKYDVYFGTANQFQKLSANQSETFFTRLPTLTYNTTYTWQIVSWDTRNASNSSAIWLFTTVHKPDTTPPTVLLTLPKVGYLYINGKEVMKRMLFQTTLALGVITIEEHAQDQESGIRNVEFYIDGILKANDTSAPYTYLWSQRSFSFKPHTIHVIAYDNAGNHARNETSVQKFF